MSRKTSRGGIPLEWKTDTVNTTDSTVTNGEFDLDLLPNEIAEIHKIDSTIALGNIPDAANDDIDVRMLMSMDPDANDSPLVNANLEDLEVFFHHAHEVQQEVGAAGTATLVNTSNKQLDLPEKHPLIVGTNFAQVVVGDASVACEFITTVYFKRRKASPVELTQILLKRR